MTGNREATVLEFSETLLDRFGADFVHKTEELVVLAEGEIEIEGRSHFPKIGEEQFIPAKALHTVRNTGSTYNVWYYGYKTIQDFD